MIADEGANPDSRALCLYALYTPPDVEREHVSSLSLLFLLVEGETQM